MRFSFLFAAGFTGGLPANFGGISNHGLVDEHGDRVEVAGMGFETEPLRFERQGTSAGERVVKRGQLVAVENLPGARMVRVRGTSPPPALPDLGPRPFQHRLIGGVLPPHQLFNEPEQAVPLQLRRHVTERVLVGQFTQHRVGCRAGQPRRNNGLFASGRGRVDSGRRVLRPTLLQRSHRGPFSSSGPTAARPRTRTGHRPSAQRSPPAPRRAAGAPTRDAVCSDARAGSTSPAPTPC